MRVIRSRGMARGRRNRAAAERVVLFEANDVDDDDVDIVDNDLYFLRCPSTSPGLLRRRRRRPPRQAHERDPPLLPRPLSLPDPPARRARGKHPEALSLRRAAAVARRRPRDPADLFRAVLRWRDRGGAGALRAEAEGARRGGDPRLRG